MRKTGLLWSAVTVLLLMAAATLFGGETRLIKEADVPYEFVVAGNTLPAGHYEVLCSDDPDANYLVFKNMATGKTTIVQYETRSAAREDGKNVMVFDLAGGKHVLSEIHLSDVDGYLLPGIKGQHTHVQLRGVQRG